MNYSDNNSKKEFMDHDEFMKQLEEKSRARQERMDEWYRIRTDNINLKHRNRIYKRFIACLEEELYNQREEIKRLKEMNRTLRLEGFGQSTSKSMEELAEQESENNVQQHSRAFAHIMKDYK